MTCTILHGTRLWEVCWVTLHNAVFKDGGRAKKLTGKCCINSSRTSMSSSVLSEGSFSRHSRTVSRTIRDCKKKKKKTISLNIYYTHRLQATCDSGESWRHHTHSQMFWQKHATEQMHFAWIRVIYLTILPVAHRHTHQVQSFKPFKNTLQLCIPF